MATLSPKHLLVMLLAVILTVGFTLSVAQASVMPATMKMTADDGIATPANVDMTADRKACLKEAGDNGNPMHCPPTCTAPVLAVLPQDVAVTTVLDLRQQLTLRAPFLRGRSSLPDPFPPKSSA